MSPKYSNFIYHIYQRELINDNSSAIVFQELGYGYLTVYVLAARPACMPIGGLRVLRAFFFLYF